MSQRLREHRCPQCEAAGTLSIEIKLVLKPIGVDHSLSGSQLKTTGWNLPVLVCSTEGCTFKHVGYFAEEGYAAFEPWEK